VYFGAAKCDGKKSQKNGIAGRRWLKGGKTDRDYWSYSEDVNKPDEALKEPGDVVEDRASEVM
jgi:hypothetical protein